MDIRLIGVIKDDKNTTIGFRLLDLDTKEVKSVTVDSAKSAIAKGVKVKGIEIVNGNLKGSNGDLSRYPVISNKGLEGKSPIIILNQLLKNNEVIGYEVSDWNGNVRNLSAEDTLRYSKVNGISNGSVKTNSNNTEFISSITGEYTKKNIGNNNISTEREKSKFRLVFSGDDTHKELLDEKYIENAKYLYSIYNSIDKKTLKEKVKFSCI